MSRNAAKAAVCALVAAFSAPQAATAIDIPTLRAKLAAQQSKLSGTSGAYVRDLVTGRTLYGRNSTRTRSPASNEKLLVTAAALLAYGDPDVRLRTELYAAAEPLDGVIDGDVALVGVGDPYLSTTRLRMVASQLKALGVTRIAGRVLGDGSYFDARRGSYDSAWQYDPDLGGSLGGLVVDRGRGGDPALYTAQRLRAQLLSVGIKVTGSARAGTLAAAEPVVLAGASSLPLADLIEAINIPSDNFAAEMLLKHLGAQFGSKGSTPAGATVVRAALSEIGVTAKPYDGSGLSRADQVSPREIVDLLTELQRLPEIGPALDESLPIAGSEGTLADRMDGTAAARRCRAKTGTLRGVSALSGYCSTTSGNTVAFSFLENNMSEYTAKQVEDRMTALIARYSDPDS
jgi:D-alanyl-D-alanine carboxypeptidase/D-alanyl-D-alanine-endopeptidase (penicillin-binding protein 4)